MGNTLRSISEYVDIETLEEKENPIIKVIGVGGGGGNAANYIYKRSIEGVGFIAVNTDVKALRNISIPTQVALSELGAGCHPDVAKAKTKEHEDEIRAKLEGTELLFISAGLGKGTGTGASPEIARIARSMNILTVSVVTLPFAFEGKPHLMRAIAGLNELRVQSDAVLIIANELINKAFGDLQLSKAFNRADEIIATAINGISSTVLKDTGYVQSDMADMRTTLTDAHDILMGVGLAEGEDRALNAIKQALDSPLFILNDISGADKILINYAYSANHEVTMNEMSTINEEIEKRVGSHPDQIWGSTADDELGDYLRLTIIVTGLQSPSDEDLINASVWKAPAKSAAKKPQAESVNPQPQPLAQPQPQMAQKPQLQAQQPLAHANVSSKQETEVDHTDTDDHSHKIVFTINGVETENPAIEDFHTEEPATRKPSLRDFDDDEFMADIDRPHGADDFQIMGINKKKLNNKTFVCKENELFVHNDFLNDNVD